MLFCHFSSAKARDQRNAVHDSGFMKFVCRMDILLRRAVFVDILQDLFITAFHTHVDHLKTGISK